MQIHQLQPNQKKKNKKRVGRGGKKGTYSGKGMKGQKSRSGKGPRPGFAGGDNPLTMRFPKKKGSRGPAKKRHGVKPALFKKVVLDSEKINKKFKVGEIVSPRSLLKKGLIGKMKGRMPQVKILGKEQLKKDLILGQVELSKGVRSDK